MSELYVIDTHALLWYMDDDSRLGYKAGQILDDENSRLLLPSIVLAEALFLLENKPYLYKLLRKPLIVNLSMKCMTGKLLLQHCLPRRTTYRLRS